MFMSQDRSFGKYVALVLPVMLIVSVLLMTNVSSAIPSSNPVAGPSSSTPLWGFQNAYMNYTGTQTSNAPPSNLSSIRPAWLHNGSYANYTFSMTYGTTITSGNYNVSLFKVNTSAMNYSAKTVTVEETFGTYDNGTTYANNTAITMSEEFTFLGPSNSILPALSSSALYFMDSGFPQIPNVTITSGVNFVALGMPIKSDKFMMTSSASNMSYYASYGSGLILNISGNGSGTSFDTQISATNIPVPGSTPFTLGMRTSTSYTKYEITSPVSNGNFTVGIAGNVSQFFGGNSNAKSFNGTFKNPNGFPALNATDLIQLNAGQAPAMFNNSTGLTVHVHTGIKITVAAGTFVTDEISSGNATFHMREYVDATSGVLTDVNFSVSMQILGLSITMNDSMSLSSTNVPMAPTGFGFLAGSVTPTGAILLVNGAIVPEYDGTYNVSLMPGSYYLSATMNGYQGKVYSVNVSDGKTTHENVALSPISNSVTLSGNVTPIGSSILVNGYMANVNATGYYSISVSTGKYTVSAYHEGYFPMSKNLTITSSVTLNISLMKEPATANSSMVKNDTVATGYNVTVSGLANENGLVSVNFTATTNGTLTVSIPYTDMKNATIAEILNSSIYINGARDKNFSITLTSNYTVILTVYNLSGDPTLYWTYSPSAVLPPSPSSTPLPTSLLEDGIAIAAIVVVVALIGVVMARRKKQSNR